MNKKRILIYGFVIFLLNLFLMYKLEVAEISLNKIRAKSAAEKQIEVFKNKIDDYVFSTEVLEVFLMSNKYKGDHFETLAAEMSKKQYPISGVQIAPNGVIKYSYPFEKHKKGMVNLFEDDKRKEEAYYARDTGITTITGPFELRQGGPGIVIRNPVYIKNAKGIKEFWGFTIIILDFQKILEESEFISLKKKGYNYEIRKAKLVKETHENELIDKIGELNNPISIPFHLFGGKWTLNIEPTPGWKNPFYKVLRYFFLFGGTLVVLYFIEKVSAKKRIETKLIEEQILNECISMLYKNNDINHSISKSLEILTKFYSGDIAYIFEYTSDRKNIINSYEWCAPGIQSQIEEFANMESDLLVKWLPLFDRKVFKVKNITKKSDYSELEYEFCQTYNINSIIAVPIIDKQGNLIGIIGVDNPKENIDNFELIDKVSKFVYDFLEKDKLIKRLDYLSFSDSLTGIRNYHSYTDTLGFLKLNPQLTIGISYFDINGLKLINDTEGHDKGDQLIISCANFLRKHFGEKIYRIGGDEFILLFEDIGEADFKKKMEILKIDLNQQNFSISSGYRWYENCENLEDKVKSADKVMYKEKVLHYANMKNLIR